MRPGGELPGHVESTSIQSFTESKDPLALKDGSQIAEVEVLYSELFDVALDFIDHILWIAGDITGGPHAGRRAERTPIGASPCGEDGHCAASVNSVVVRVFHVVIDWKQMPRGPDNTVEFQD